MGKSQKLRVLIEVDGNIWTDRLIEVEHVSLEQSNGIRTIPSSDSEPWVHRELDGTHTITLDWRDKA